jgi:ABC-type branched-subunit amino acid transport system substrate-binding protein
MSTAAAHRRWGLILAGLTGGACSLALDFDQDIPCATDDECVYSNGAGTCEQGFCVPPGGASSDTEDTTSADDDDDSMTMSESMTSPTEADSTMGDSESTGTPVACEMNSECEMDQRCAVNGTCVDLLSAECQKYQWPLNGERDNVVFVGSIMPTGEPFTALIEPLQNAVQLAIEDFNEETTLQGDRQIAWVACDDTAGNAASILAAEHLVDIVGVPAIVGPIFSESVLEVAEEVTIEDGVFLITPTASAMSIAALQDMDLVWRTIPGDVYQGNALVDRMVIIDEEGPGGNITDLLILAKDDAYGDELLTAVLPDLEAALPDANITSDTYPNPTSFDSMDELVNAYSAVLAGVSSAGPYSHVIFIGTSEVQFFLYNYFVAFSPLENPVPLFTITHGAVPEMERFINEIVPDTPQEGLIPLKPVLEDNLQGTSPIVLNPVNFNAFSLRYRIRFDGDEPLTSAALSYDATLATLFAACTVPADEDITGAAIAAAMPQLTDPSGELISFSGEDISFIEDARNALTVQGGSVELQGVSGELEWDLETGDVRAGVWGWVLCDDTVDGSMPSANPAREYMLDDKPAEVGTWVDYPDPCQ